MLTCKEVSRAIASEEVTTADWKQRLAVRLHLLMCRHCRRYARQMEAIGDATRQILGDTPADGTSRDRLRDSILDRLPPAADQDSDTRL